MSPGPGPVPTIAQGAIDRDTAIAEGLAVGRSQFTADLFATTSGVGATADIEHRFSPEVIGFAGAFADISPVREAGAIAGVRIDF